MLRLVIELGLGFAIGMQEQRVIGYGFFDELFEKEKLGAVDDSVDALLEGLHRREGLKRIAEENDCCMAALAHWHVLNRLQSEIFVEVVGGEPFLENDDLVADLAETDEEIAMGRSRVNLVAQFGQGAASGFEPLRGGKGQQRGFIGSAKEFKF